MPGNGNHEPTASRKTGDAPDNQKERIAKVIARAGLCSRRDAEAWILDGRVSVNGAVLSSPALAIGPADIVLVDGRPLPMRQPPRVWRLNKPAGLVTTRKDEAGRQTVFDRLPETLPRVVTVGRLDLNSEGLLLLTNDGELARYLEMPSTGWLRRYRVRVHGRVDERQLADLAQGITVDGIRYQGIEAMLDRQQGANAWLTIGLKEGKNREIRKVMEALGYSVSRLIRVSYGPFHLGNLPEGEVEEIKASVLRDQLGSVLANLTKRSGSWMGDGVSPDRRSGRTSGGQAANPKTAASTTTQAKRRVRPQPGGGHSEFQLTSDRPGRDANRPDKPHRPSGNGRHADRRR